MALLCTYSLQVFSGHLQLDNCVFEQGQVHVCSPGTVNVRYCTFNSAHVCFKGAGFSNVSNCKFKPDRVAVSVEEPSLSARLRVLPTNVGGWVEMLQTSSMREYYNSRVKQMNAKSKASQEFDRFINTSESSIECENKSTPDTRSSISSKDGEIDPLKGKKAEPGYCGRRNSNRTYDCFDSEAKSLLSSIRGIIFTNNKIEGGRGGITVSRMGHAWIENNVISGLVYGIRCVQNSKVIILNNSIQNCETSAIFMREHSTGLIAGNQIFGNSEAGIDLRSNASPVIQHNHIYSGRRSGVVCLDNGRGIIRDNDIYNNKEAGVYVLYKGNPHVKYVLVDRFFQFLPGIISSI